MKKKTDKSRKVQKKGKMGKYWKVVKVKKTRKAVKVKKVEKPVKELSDKKVVFIFVDGMADLPAGGEQKTPLSEARKKNIDWLAKNGVTGEMTVVPAKRWNSMANASVSHIAAVSLLGYNIDKLNLKRGPMEAIGSDIPYQNGHLAMRCNFASVDENLKVTDRRAGRSSQGLSEISRYINEHVKIGVPFIFKRTHGHRAVLVVKMGLSDKIVLNDPLDDGKNVAKISGSGSEGVISAKILQDFVDKSHEVIEYHPANSKRISEGLQPANYILLREAGNEAKKLMPDFPKRFGVNPVCISEPGAVRGACLLAGFKSVKVPEGNFRESLDFIFRNIDFALENHDFVFAHIKGPIDEASHDGDFQSKKNALELLDKKLEKFRKFDGTVIITTDHITSTEKKKHMPGKVPLLVFGRGKDATKSFDEFTAVKGKLKDFSPFKLIRYSLGK